MPKQTDLQLDAGTIIEAAIDILREEGLDAVSMRSVGARLGVSPVPLYSRIGNKESLLNAVAARLLADLAPTADDGEEWPVYAARWARVLRGRVRAVLALDTRLILADARPAYVRASQPLLACMRAGGLPMDVAIQGCRLLMWATVGFVAMEKVPQLPARSTGQQLTGSNPAGVSMDEVDELFELQIHFVIDGIERTAKEHSP